MAGAKETPRQKLIGMMYLVLTALLALQVSSAIILKFKFLDDSLMTVNNKTKADNDGVRKSIESTVAKGGNRPNDKKVLDQASEVRAKTTDIINYVEGLRAELIKRSGGMVGDTYKDPSAEDAVATYMIGANKGKGKAYELKDRLNKYANEMRVYNPNIPQLALDAKDDPVAKKDRVQRSKDFAELNFEATPLTAALAVLAQKETEILKYEADVLQELASRVGADIIKFDKIFGNYSAASNTVAAGTKYSAEMFIAATSSAIAPRMFFEGRPVKVENGRGKVEFLASAGAYDKDGNAKKTWKGQIKMTQNGRDTTFNVSGEYTVAKPVMSIQSASVQALYLNCGNKLDVQVPALGALYDPAFSASGAQVSKGTKKGEVMVLPTARQVTLNVSSGGAAIGNQTFQVRPVPRPEIVCLANGRPVDEKRGLPSPGPRQITVEAIADETFKNMLPQDARFRVTEFEVTLARGKNIVQEQSFSNKAANITSMAAQARPGDRLIVTVKELKRANYKDQFEDVPVGNRSFTIALN
ncbi:type IX secretion system motor protein PorM/GldM [Adhaeribacter radiodurans]|uniref:Gliding motility protein GldM n=1 Tax=Adhaeribacter radiodurans TaxID=2745197 RepID=A0A7L7L275_9BACT|nr:gliding motility protein GldM [Adhaeribacter radiodurans]QMU26891.1 gliding motility protein GldM [Adhaeribacter radiodurans]